MHIILAMTLAVSAGTFDFREYAEAQWGDIVLIGNISHFCYGEPPNQSGPANVKCVNLERIKTHRCSVKLYQSVVVACNKDI